MAGMAGMAVVILSPSTALRAGSAKNLARVLTETDQQILRFAQDDKLIVRTDLGSRGKPQETS